MWFASGRDAEAGSSTQWQCSDLARLSFVAQIYHFEGGSADCLYWGEYSWEEGDELPECDQALEDLR